MVTSDKLIQVQNLKKYYNKGETELLAAVNAALAKAYDAGYYDTWYQEALDIAASASAIEVTLDN